MAASCCVTESFCWERGGEGRQLDPHLEAVCLQLQVYQASFKSPARISAALHSPWIWSGEGGLVLPHRLPRLLSWPGPGPDRPLASAVRQRGSGRGLDVHVRGACVLPSLCLSACVSLRFHPVVCLPVCRSPGSPRGLSGCEAVSRSAPWSVCLCVGLRVRPAVCRGLRGCLTLLVLRMSNMSGKPSVTSSSLYSSSLMELKSRRRLCTTE